ncbi:hypothetical protein T01_6781 [Trichinella spiralis]|uniref:Uncharacterized protein n=1 Tax=Trichinella spiralis TaxID=6334 RepID=A0A0V0Z1Y4_TRISP|nr:hypothetical protein T01_6781 [Trichinella spiralis]
MTSSYLRHHLLGIRSQQMKIQQTVQKRKLCSVVENGRVLDVRAVTSDIPAKDF